MHEATFERLARQPNMEALYGHHLAAYLAETPDGAVDALRLARAEVAGRPIAPSYEVLSWVLFRLGRVGDALQASRQSLASNNSDATGLYRAGIVHLAAGQAEAGHQLLALALERRFELDPADERDVRRRLGNLGPLP